MHLNSPAVMVALATAIVGANPLKNTATLDPSLVHIRSFSSSGAGCPAGTVSATLSADGSRLTFGVDSFRAEIGSPSLPVSARTRNCQLLLDLQRPDGWHFGAIDTAWHGFAQLDPGVAATITTTYYITSRDAATYSRFDLNGSDWAVGGVFDGKRVFPAETIIWSSCDERDYLAANSRVSLTSSTGNGYGVFGIDDVSTILQIGIAWKAC